MKSTILSPSSYIVLGLIDAFGPATSYDLKGCADAAIGHFWSFSRAQLYKEPARLVALGLLSETSEADGRKRRVYALTEKGKESLQAWFESTTTGSAELRDPGLLKLYFANGSSRAGLDRLIEDRLAVHRNQLEAYKKIAAEMHGKSECTFYLATVRMGLEYERMAIGYWENFATGFLD